jgi:hypothetical protein
MLCDDCGQEHNNEININIFVLTSSVSTFTGTHYVHDETEVARVEVTLCERCMKKRDDDDQKQRRRPKGIWNTIKWLLFAPVRPYFSPLEAVALDKLRESYPETVEIAKRGGTGCYIKTLMEWGGEVLALEDPYSTTGMTILAEHGWLDNSVMKYSKGGTDESDDTKRV